MHVYGLTETYGHILQCAWNQEWDDLNEDEKADISARQGVRYPNLEDVDVMDPESMKPVPRDGKTIGEIMIRGNVVNGSRKYEIGSTRRKNYRRNNDTWKCCDERLF